MPVTFSAPLVLLSVAIAIAAAFVALDTTSRTAVAKGGFRASWLAGGSFAMGLGIWAMHYVGMMAYQLPVPVRYDVPTVSLSLVAAVGASLAALTVVTRESLTWPRALVGSLVMGSGIATMHYVGMASMRLPAVATWDRLLVVLSVLIAIVVSFVALLLTSRLRGEARHFAPPKLLAAAVMGLAIAAVPYTGMAAAAWTPDSSVAIAPNAVAVTTLGVGGIVALTFVVFAFVVAISSAERQLTARSRELRASEERYRLLFLRSLTGNYRSDRDGRLLECNAALAQIFGYSSPEEFMAYGLDDIYRDPTGRAAFLAQLDVTGSVVDVEREMRRRDGTTVWVLEHATLLRATDGGGDLIEGNLIDISRRKETDAALARAVEASDSANRAKSEFLANMSHEIRTPMNGILGMADVVLRSELTPDQREAIDVIKLSAESLMDLINDILDYSKIEAERLELDPIEFNLHDVVEDSVRTLAPRAHLKGLELICDVSVDLPRRVIGDPGRVRQVLLNLLSNAIKFTEQGEVEVRAEAEVTEDGQAVVQISVRDSGIGIPAEKQEMIFEAFTQADSSTTRRYGGTGLGLTITSHLLGMMRGRIVLESREGSGSTFRVRIPMPLAESPPDAPPPIALTDLRDLTVLVVDDNATNRRILEDTLVHWGLRPTLVDDGAAAIETLNRAQRDGRPFGLVLLDFQMPDMDGFEVAAAIKELPGIAGTTIMMLSSVGERGDGQRCRALGVRAYLTKPVRQSVLLDAILNLGAYAKARAAAVAAGEDVAARATNGAPLVTRHTLRRPELAGRALRVLLAEDNPVNQLVASKMLEARGHTVVVVPDGRQAVARSASETFDVILMDVQMPILDGREAAIEIRASESRTGGHIPIIAVTASAMDGDREKCVASGMDGYLSKPIQYETFIEEVERCTAAGDLTIK